MKKICGYKFSFSFFFLNLLTFFIWSFNSFAILGNGKVTETTGNTIILVAVVCLGGLISILGVIMVFRGIGGESDVDLTLSKKAKISFKKISQGVVVIIIGALILLGALYIGKEKRSFEGRDIIIKEETMER